MKVTGRLGAQSAIDDSLINATFEAYFDGDYDDADRSEDEDDDNDDDSDDGSDIDIDIDLLWCHCQLSSNCITDVPSRPRFDIFLARFFLLEQ